MKLFYYDVSDLSFAPNKECKICPHRKNSIKSSEGCMYNPLERYEVYHNFMSKSQKYPDVETARSALRVFCSLDYIFGRHHRDLTMSEKLSLSLKYDFKYQEDKCYCNGVLFAEIRKL